MTIKAIETVYAGCRFRSRLEARWAVFLDAMGIAWQYEAQGYELNDRLGVMRADTAIYYLPDFWLPEFNLHAEVKGALSDDELRRTLTVAAALSAPDGGCGGGHDSVILGPIPDPDHHRSSYPYRLHLHKGCLYAAPFLASNAHQPCGDECPWQWFGDKEIASDAGTVSITGPELLSGYFDEIGYRWAAGYRAARSARFEHGAQG